MWGFMVKGDVKVNILGYMALPCPFLVDENRETPNRRVSKTTLQIVIYFQYSSLNICFLFRNLNELVEK